MISDLELSTQLIIHELQARGYRVDVLDTLDNIIRISGKGKTEYIKQATKTSLDSYITPLLMENKLVTKKILLEAGLATPGGESYTSLSDFESDWLKWQDRAFVVKPNSTNFGKGISMFPEAVSFTQYRRAGEIAFAEDKRILVEHLISGKEYRFLVIGDQVRAVLHRIPANVTGDGISSIEELVSEKNKDPRRGVGYVKPLEQIKLGEVESDFLGGQQMKFSSIPKKGEQIFLRENSNISTGGDSIDMTDQVCDEYREIAVKAAQAVGAKICGIDLIIPNIAKYTEGYSIIELNFNPALHIHDYPAVGKNRHVEKYVLDEMGLI